MLDKAVHVLFELGAAAQGGCQCGEDAGENQCRGQVGERGRGARILPPVDSQLRCCPLLAMPSRPRRAMKKTRMLIHADVRRREFFSVKNCPFDMSLNVLVTRNTAVSMPMNFSASATV